MVCSFGESTGTTRMTRSEFFFGAVNNIARLATVEWKLFIPAFALINFISMNNQGIQISFPMFR